MRNKCKVLLKFECQFIVLPCTEIYTGFMGFMMICVFFVLLYCMKPQINLRRSNCLETNLRCCFEVSELRSRYYIATSLIVDIKLV